ncbi:MAG: type I methionyl aminopeptidase [Candidatus Shapirobacteria bacterium]
MSDKKALTYGGRKLSDIFGKTLEEIKEGKRLEEINQIAQDWLDKEDFDASFKTVGSYQWATCINLNSGVVHGIPDKKEIKKGDLVSLDMGLVFKNQHFDMAYTLEVGTKKESEFLKAGETALQKAILMAKAGGFVGDLSRAIQQSIEDSGYKVVKDLTGHGVGSKLHVFPNIPGFLKGKAENTPKLKKEMTLAIEIIYSKGSGEIKLEPDGWTISAQDGKMTALFEKTILVDQNRAEELTPFSWNYVQRQSKTYF